VEGGGKGGIKKTYKKTIGGTKKPHKIIHIQSDF